MTAVITLNPTFIKNTFEGLGKYNVDMYLKSEYFYIKDTTSKTVIKTFKVMHKITTNFFDLPLVINDKGEKCYLVEYYKHAAHFTSPIILEKLNMVQLQKPYSRFSILSL